MAGLETICEVNDLVAHYGDRLILDGVSFRVRKGEILVILGASGSGKSTLLKHIVGLLTPTSGSIRLWGQDIVRMEEDERAAILRRMGIAFQSGGLFNSMTIGGNVALPLREWGDYAEETIQDMVRMKLSLVGLAEFQHLMPSELSGGMKKRAGFARALALEPEIVFFDEPSAGLDPIMAAGLDELLLKLKGILGITMVIVTHELESIRTVADRAVMLDKGKLIFAGTLRDAEQSRAPRVRQFFDRRPDDVIAARDAGSAG
jgi:phospholipid/cholesterol/gamma-HCH transport system ATP-binding protein